ncbi:MAG: thiamine pyrophosphate-binding protein [Candidatus Ancaeobacter aquaticus]|nr:thiamine pyrophosphate-binding protein [Candidatus Ancaeobacter aquaticus]
MWNAESTTVGKYLAHRLGQAGLKHIFGVPGDYVLSFFDCLEESNIEVVCNCNELNAGYAADGYARINGIGAVCITYGVGAFSVFNAVVGSFAERLPVVVISGGPKISERQHHHLLHHTIGDMNLQYRIYEEIMAASVILTSADQAPSQIDETISTCLRSRRPVYIEVPMDIVTKPCRVPGPFTIDTDIKSDEEAVTEALNDAVSILTNAKKPVILAGVEVHRLDIRKDLEDFITHSGYPYSTTLLGKSVIPEKHPQFIGIYGGAASREYARKTIEEADVILCLGTLMTDVQIGQGEALLDSSRMIVANSDNVKIKHHVYNSVSLKDFINGLAQKLPKGKADTESIEHPSKDLEDEYIAIPDQKLTLRRFYQRVNRFIEKNNIIVTDTGDAIFCTGNMYLPEGVDFVDQAFYLSIGYSVPATLGVKLAAPDKRPITFVGDGAFQMTAQELSTIIRHNLNPIIFLINNEGYTIERVLDDGPYNDLQMWKYNMLPEVFNGPKGFEVKTEGDLEKALASAQDNPDSLAFIEVHFDRWDCSESLQKLGKGFKSGGNL